MIISRQEIETVVKPYLAPNDLKHLERIVDMTWACTLATQFALYCPEAEQGANPEKFLALVERLGEAKRQAGLPASTPTEYELFACAEDGHPEAEDLAAICDVYHKMVVENGAPAANVLSWLKDAWNAGARQTRILAMEIEGNIMNLTGLIENFAAGLAIFGQRKGLLAA